METIKLKKATITFVNGESVKYENIEFSQKGNIMVFSNPNGSTTIMNFDNICRMNFIEDDSTENA